MAVPDGSWSRHAGADGAGYGSRHDGPDGWRGHDGSGHGPRHGDDGPDDGFPGDHGDHDVHPWRSHEPHGPDDAEVWPGYGDDDAGTPAADAKRDDGADG